MKKKIDIIVEARLSSKRLPQKVMLKVLERPLLDLMIERLKKINFVENIIIATTTNKIDDEIVNLANNSGVKFFRGSEKDRRQHQRCRITGWDQHKFEDLRCLEEGRQYCRGPANHSCGKGIGYGRCARVRWRELEGQFERGPRRCGW